MERSSFPLFLLSVSVLPMLFPQVLVLTPPRAVPRSNAAASSYREKKKKEKRFLFLENVEKSSMNHEDCVSGSMRVGGFRAANTHLWSDI